MSQVLQVLTWPVRKVGDVLSGEGDAAGGATTLAAFLAGALALVATALSVIGLGDNDVDRAVINHKSAAMFAFGAIVVAVCLGSAMSVTKNARVRGLFGVAGLLALGTGLVMLASAAVEGRAAKDRPRIDVKLTREADGTHVKGTVTAEGMRADDHVLLRVIGISSRHRLAEAHIGHRMGGDTVAPCPADEQGSGETGKVLFKRSCWRQLMWSSRIGANPDGTVNAPIDTLVATGLYDRVDIEARLVARGDRPLAGREPRCDENDREFGCTTIMIVPTERRPELDAHWELPAGSPPVLDITARMGDLTMDDRVLLSVRRVLPAHNAGLSRIYGASWAPNAGGEVSAKISIPIATHRRAICVIMRSLEASVQPRGELPDGFGPCGARSQGLAVQLYAPPAARRR
jgi:hypothetical protein